jgi:heat shock protein HslJ
MLPGRFFFAGNYQNYYRISCPITVMNDDLQESPQDRENAETDRAAILQSQPIGLTLYIALGLVGLLVLLIIFINIPGIKASAGVSMTLSSWMLQSYGDTTGTLVPVEPGTQVTALFGSDGNVSGSAGCNQYSASYKVRDFAISTSSPTLTKIFCSDPNVMQQESAYINDLLSAVELRISESNLKLYDKSGKTVLVFVKQ